MRMKRFRGEGWALLGMIWALAWPTMLEQLMSTAVQYVDAAMVGRLGRPRRPWAQPPPSAG